MVPSDFWSPFEETIDGFKDLSDFVEEVFTKWEKKNRLFAWRGLVSADWELHSSLYRRLAWTSAAPHGQRPAPDEKQLYAREASIMKDVHRWGLHVSSSGARLSAMSQLAALQHYGAPTRLIDVTFNPWIAAWFAIEEKWHNGERQHEDEDARLFAIDVTQRLINENDKLRGWADDLSRPWPSSTSPRADDEVTRERQQSERREWCTNVYAWQAPHFDSRIAAQNGGFIFGGVPMTTGGGKRLRWPKGPGDSPDWSIEEVRRATSVALRPHKLRTAHGGVSQGAVYTFRIAAGAKREIRDRLERSFGYKHSTIYPDLTGFASFATPDLRTSP